MINVAIVDDDEKDIRLLEGYLDRYCKEREADLIVHKTEYTCGEEFLADKPSAFDVVLLDIEMPGINGLTTARMLRDRNETIAIMFITNMAQYAINGYEVEAVDFVVKPVSYFDFSMKFSKIRRHLLRKGEKTVTIKANDGEMTFVHSDDIYYIEVIQHYLEYHTKKGVYRVRGTMKEIEEELENYSFARCSKSFLVNMKNIITVKGDEIRTGNETLYVSRTRKAEFLEKFTGFLGGRR